jgi:Flp pilus assembly pilin Flp
MSEITRKSHQTDLCHTDESGQTMAEYGLVLTVITIAIVTAFTVLSGAIEGGVLRVVALVPEKSNRVSGGPFRAARYQRKAANMNASRKKISFRREDGQTMVEFALVIPILCLVLFAIIQFGILYNNYVTLTDATRIGARKAAVSRQQADPVGETVAKVRGAATGLDLAKLEVSVAATAWEHGEDVTVEARYPYSVDLLGFVVASGKLTSKTTERVE